MLSTGNALYRWSFLVHVSAEYPTRAQVAGAAFNPASAPIPVVPARTPIPAACNGPQAANAAANIRSRFIVPSLLLAALHLTYPERRSEGNCSLEHAYRLIP